MSSLLCLCVLPTLLSPAQAPSSEARLAMSAAEALYAGIRETTLPNGLRVYLKPIPSSTSVTTLVVYKVGSADEDKDCTGLSHYLEHLMFKGTARLKPGDIDRITFRAGGSNNAYTSTDLTAYHFTLPADRWLDALQVEADRMRNLRIDREHEFDKEKGAVINELAGNEDSPWDLEYKAMLPLLFGKAHPYGHPVIGEARHVREATEKVIQAHYDRWYHPNNAALVMVGGFDADQALTAIRKQFGSIPAGKLPPRKQVPEDQPKLPIRQEMPSKFSVPRLLLAYPTVRVGAAEEPALAVLEALLGRGKRSRLYASLVEGTAVASSVEVSHSSGRYGGWLGVFVDVLPGQNRAAVEKRLLEELARLGKEPVAEEELRRIKQQLLASAVFERESTYQLADSIGQAVTLTDLDHARKYLPRILAVTAADVQRVAREFLSPTRSVTLWSVPAGKPMGAASSNHPARSARQAGKGQGQAFDLKKTRRVVLPNGLTLLVLENRRLPIVTARLSLRQSTLYQKDDKLGIAALTGLLLDEGTTRRTGKQIAEAIENVGGQLSLDGSGGNVRVLSSNRSLGLELLLECLTQPAFADEAVARRRAQMLAELGEEEAQPRSRAARVFQKAVYGDHPLGRPSRGTTQSVAKLTGADCKAYHAQVFVPNNAILTVVGDCDAEAVIAEVTRLTANWNKAELPALNLPTVKRPEKFQQTILSMPQAAQLQVFLGHVGVRRNDPDYYKLLVMDHILGTGPGFTDRLSSRLRDREGLAYTVSATITASAGLEQGTFVCYIGTDNDQFARVKELIVEELRRIRDTRPTAEEVEDVKAYLLGSQLLRFGTTQGIAGQLVALERFGLGLDALEVFRKQVAAVTAEDVQAVARKYIDPERLVVVAAGAVDEQGRPLQKE